MLPYICLIAYLTAAALNLFAAAKKRPSLFAATKPLLLLILCAYCFFRGAPAPDLLLIGALFACWLGDVLLMVSGDVWFTAGGIAFLTGHVLLILLFARQTDPSRLPAALLIPAAAVYLGIACLIMIRSNKEAPRLMKVPILLYLLCNATMNCFALSRAAAAPALPAVLAYVGALLFFLSDCLLFLVRYDTGKKQFFKSDFWVMFTYVTGVLLITVGLASIR